jgi:hypothetical protein
MDMEHLKHLSQIPELVSMIDPSGNIAPGRVAKAFGLSKAQLARTLGLTGDAFYVNRNSATSQRRLAEMIEILARVTAWAGGRGRALSWYRAQPMPAFGSRTAESLVKTGQASVLRDYLDHLALGNFA